MLRVIEQHPALGYLGGLVAAIPPWVLDLRDWIGIVGAIVGVAVGVVTLAIQVRAWRRG